MEVYHYAKQCSKKLIELTQEEVTKTRYTLPGALLATLAGMVASVVLAGRMM